MKSKRFRILLALCFFLTAQAHCKAVNELPNAGFEHAKDGVAKHWRSYGRGYEIDRATFHGGGQSIKCTGGDHDGMGVLRVVTYDVPDRRPITISGWSRAENVAPGGDYCIFLDIFYEDDEPWWARTSPWQIGTHGWQYTEQTFYPEKPVKEIRTYVFLRRTTGTAWFDDVALSRGKVGLYVKQFGVAPDYPHTRTGIHINALLTNAARWRCSLLDADGGILVEKKGKGRKVVWQWPGRAGKWPTKARITAKAPNLDELSFETDIQPLSPADNPVRKDYAVWTRNSMKKIYPTEFPLDPLAAPHAKIELARNEREGLQIAVTPADNVSLKDVTIRIGAFSNEKGGVFPSEHIRWHVVGYLWIETPSGHPNAPDKPNWCPDALLPARPFDALGGRTQGVWLNFFASEETGPGIYRGKITVAPANAPSTDVPVTVRVRDFSLPKSPRMKTAFSIMDGFTKHTYGKITPKLRRQALDIMLDHRLNPDDISRTEPPPIEDLLYARSRGMNTFNILNIVPKPEPDSTKLWVWRSPVKVYGPEFNKKFAARIDAYIEQLRKHGLSKMAYFYGFDECGGEYDEAIKSTCKFLKDRYPEIETFTTAGYTYQRRAKVPPDYEDHIDWYCPLTSLYRPELSEKLRKLGKETWWYVCCVPKYPYANWSMDYPTIEGRLLSWMTFANNVDGLLFWHVNYWGENKIIDSGDTYLDWNSACILNMTGDGTLTYPTPQGFAASIRLENIRDGIEDYDYLGLLAEKKGRHAAIRYYDNLIKSLKQYSRDPADLYNIRSQIAEQLEAAMKSP